MRFCDIRNYQGRTLEVYLLSVNMMMLYELGTNCSATVTVGGCISKYSTVQSIFEYAKLAQISPRFTRFNIILLDNSRHNML
jgi:hypothetical protein